MYPLHYMSCDSCSQFDSLPLNIFEQLHATLEGDDTAARGRGSGRGRRESDDDDENRQRARSTVADEQADRRSAEDLRDALVASSVVAQRQSHRVASMRMPNMPQRELAFTIRIVSEGECFTTAGIPCESFSQLLTFSRIFICLFRLAGNHIGYRSL